MIVMPAALESLCVLAFEVACQALLLIDKRLTWPI